MSNRLTIFLIALNVAVFFVWLPEYLSWPWWTDHDVFATMARGWDAGLLPYRDLKGNNFPGTMYLFWMLGRSVGWGNTASFYVLDVGFLLFFVAALLTWSKRCFASFLPGLVGWTALMPYYLSLDFSLAAQRDWQAPLLAVSGILIAQALPGRWGRVPCAILFAFAVTIRPQVVLLMPAAILAVCSPPDASTEPAGKVLPVVEFLAVLAVSLAVTFSPLWIAGIFPDFVRGVRRVAYGSNYNRVRPGEFLGRLVYQIAFNNKLVILILSLYLPYAVTSFRRITAVWNVAFLLALLYFPLSPKAFPYALHALWIVWAVDVAVVAQLVTQVSPRVPLLQSALVILLALGLNPTIKPGNANISRFWRLITGTSTEADRVPLGYKHAYGWRLYRWEDYQSALGYLRSRTSPTTRVANLLRVAITGPADRLPAFPAESTSWLIMIDGGDEALFASALANATNSVVAWAPDVPSERGEFPRLEETVRRFYEPDVRFGDIEVWKRKIPAPLVRAGARDPRAFTIKDRDGPDRWLGAEVIRD